MPKAPSTPFWQVVDTVATLFSQAYMLARTRAASHPSPIVRALAGRDHANVEAQLLDREAAILRAQRSQLAPHRRPEYAPEQRAEILQLMRLRGWSPRQAADRFVLHANTIRSWRKAAGEDGSSRLLGEAPWNKLHEGVRWLVHEIRRLCPEREFGTRTIARHIVRAGIQISRTSVRRILTEEPPERPAQAELKDDAAPAPPEKQHLLKPKEPNKVWHLDFTNIRFLWLHWRVAAIVDGFSRKLLALRLYTAAPKTDELLRLVNRTVHREGRPRFLITDHGCQFRDAFQTAVEAGGTTLVRGRVGSWRINAKVERVFRTLKLWQRLSLWMLNSRGVQRKLHAYRTWYNHHRPHGALGVRTPEEAGRGTDPPTPIAFRHGGETEPVINLSREHFRGDPHMPLLHLRLTTTKRAA